MDPERRARWLRRREGVIALCLITSTVLSVIMTWSFALVAWPFSRDTPTWQCGLSVLYVAFNAAAFLVLRRKLRALPDRTIRNTPLQLS